MIASKSKIPVIPPRSSCTCGSLRRASRRISQYYDTVLAPLGIKSTQFSILSEVARSGPQAPVTMCVLAAAMVMDRSTLGHNLRPLTRDKLLTLRLSPTDRRKRCVELTAKGVSLLRRARRMWRVAENRIENTFGREATAELRAVLLNIAFSRELDSNAAGTTGLVD